MSLENPQRIFRSSFPAWRSHSVTVSLAAVCVLGGLSVAGAALLQASSDLSGRVTAHAPMEITASPDRVAVIDGATLSLGGRVVLLRDVPVPAPGEICKGPTGTADDCGRIAANVLADLVHNRSVRCRIPQPVSRGVTLAECDSGGARLNEVLRAAGRLPYRF